ncbi:MAG: CDP-alcohol phosphatidyltransferase family protein [Candidatus Eremiobacteraeota bacterium]|nr:CDP-alcohol phosphatidyltransferase family protein [Candidatus Eremiobacteraeota bacterium]
MTDLRAQAPRRPLASREKKWAKVLAQMLCGAGVSPNAISLLSLVFSVFAGIALWRSGDANGALRVVLLLIAAASIQLRLLCNLLDGMVAIEGGRRTPYGELFNDVPDRFADAIIFVGAGYGLSAFPWGPALGCLAALFAVLTAYVRLLGGTIGARQYFIGPMAKQHRMAVMTVACVLSTLEPLAGWHGQILACALAVVVAGSMVTFVRRVARIVADISAR